MGTRWRHRCASRCAACCRRVCRSSRSSLRAGAGLALVYVTLPDGLTEQQRLGLVERLPADLAAVTLEDDSVELVLGAGGRAARRHHEFTIMSRANEFPRRGRSYPA